jgi:molecular chaperone GrpE
MIMEEGVEEIVSEGMLFDPHQHEVLDCEETEKVTENSILKVYQKGYRYKNRIIRPSKVKIAIPPKPEKKKKK